MSKDKKPQHRILHETDEGCLMYVPKMAEGGLVESLKAIAANMANSVNSKPTNDAWIKNAQDSYKGMKKQSFADGGMAAPGDAEMPLDPAFNVNLDAPLMPQGQPAPGLLSSMGAAMGIGSEISPTAKAAVQQIAMPAAAPAEASVQAAPSMPSNVPLQPAAASAGANYPMFVPPTAGINAQQSAQLQAGEALAQQAKQQEMLYKQQQERQADFMKDWQTFTQQNQQEINAIREDLKAGHIDPKRFWNEKSDLGKASTVVGLILGGLGAGMAGGENQALKMLNMQIDRDVKAQEMDMSKKQNLMSALMQQGKSKAEAMSLTKSFYIDQMQAQLQEAASKANSTVARANAQNAWGQLQQQKDALFQQMGMLQALRNGSEKGTISPAQAVQLHPMATEGQKAEAFKEIKETEDRNTATQQVTDVMNKIAQLQSVGNRVMSPMQSKALINAYNTAITSKTREIFGGLNETELEQVRNNLINLTDSPSTVFNKMKLVQEMMTKEHSTPHLDGLGIKIKKFKPMVGFPVKSAQ